MKFVTGFMWVLNSEMLGSLVAVLFLLALAALIFGVIKVIAEGKE